MKKIYFLVYTLVIFFNAKAQESQSIIFASPNYTYQIPMFDMAEQYGNNSLVGLDLNKLSEHNILYGFSSHFLFGSQVKDSTMLDHLMDENRNIIDQNGQYADVLLQERGFNFSAKLGYFFASEKNPSSGIMTYGSVGFLQHKTRIDVRNTTVPQLQGDYLKMYDRLSNGLSTSLFAGYMHISQKNHAHLYCGLEFTRAFTYNQRDFNYSPLATHSLRNDSFLGLKLGWIIPIGKRSTQEFYYY